MTTDFTGATGATGPAAEAAAQAERAATGPQDAILEKLVERVGGRANVKAVFGDPITRNGKTVVPVAKIRWGFGGGSGTGTSPAEGEAGGVSSGSGTGGGGGVTAEPIGYLEIDDEAAAFKPIASPYPSPIFLLAAGFAGALVIRAIARLVRG